MCQRAYYVVKGFLVTVCRSVMTVRLHARRTQSL